MRTTKPTGGFFVEGHADTTLGCVDRARKRVMLASRDTSANKHRSARWTALAPRLFCEPYIHRRRVVGAYIVDGAHARVLLA
jgi:hypothetical protein